MPQKKTTKADMVERIFPEVKASKKNIRRIMNLFVEEIKEALTQDRVVELRGFGTFERKARKGGKARNPKTGASVEVEEHSVVAFRPGRDLKRLCWALKDEGR